MNNELQVFNSEEFGAVRVIEVDGEVKFVAKDMADVLGYSNSRKAIRDHCKKATPIGGNESFLLDPQTVVIPESDVYRLILRSKLPSAERFEEYVTGDILPTIRKHGAYMTPQKIEEVLLNPDTIIRLATDLKAERAQRIALTAKAQQDAPKVLFANSVETSHTSILIGDLAKILRQNGVNIGQNRLFQWLREKEYLIKGGSSKNMPTQKAMEMELFEVKERTINNPDGSVRITKTTKVTGRGQVYFINKFLGTEQLAL